MPAEEDLIANSPPTLAIDTKILQDTKGTNAPDSDAIFAQLACIQELQVKLTSCRALSDAYYSCLALHTR